VHPESLSALYLRGRDKEEMKPDTPVSKTLKKTPIRKVAEDKRRKSTTRLI